MTNKTDKLPTKEELQAVKGEPQQRQPVEYEIPRTPRSILIDRNTNTPLPQPPQQQQRKDTKKGERNNDGADDELPAKYRGKTVQEIIEMHQNAERALGQKANELGTMRDIVEKVAQLKRQDDLDLEGDDGQETPVNITGDELLTNPTEAINKIVAQSTGKQTKEITETVQQLQARVLMEDFRKKHPTYEQDMTDDNFREWVSKSAYRQRLAAKASQQGDLDAADELFTAWEEVRDAYVSDGTRNDDDSEGKPDKSAEREQLLADARLERSGSAALGQFQNRVFSHKEILDLRLKDPDLYYSDDMQRILAEAYAEGRVR